MINIILNVNRDEKMNLKKINTTDAEIIKKLNERRNKIVSRTGGWFAGKGVYSHGYSMLDELVGYKSYFQILILNATGKLVERKIADCVEAIYGCLSWPDPRIWCNQIGAFAGAARTSPIAATVMGCLATDSKAYGVLPIADCARFIQQALQKIQSGTSIEKLLQDTFAANNGKKYVVGYKRPIAKGDERIVTMERVCESLEVPEGPHLKLAFEIEKVLMEEFDESMNIGGYVAALLSDQDFTVDEIYQLLSTLVASGVTACYLDVLHQPTDSFLPLRCDDMDYQGKAPRTLPKHKQ
jgi:hypothetical protein